MGYANVTGRNEEAIAHLMTTNNWDRATADEHIDRAFKVWKQRSYVDWTLDLKVLTDAGVSVQPPPAANARREVATRNLREVRVEETTAPTRRGWRLRRQSGPR
jgi:hypothetical protein